MMTSVATFVLYSIGGRSIKDAYGRMVQWRNDTNAGRPELFSETCCSTTSTTKHHSFIHSFISNLSDDRSTASSKTIPPFNAI
jgi:hypothetical protein